MENKLVSLAICTALLSGCSTTSKYDTPESHASISGSETINTEVAPPEPLQEFVPDAPIAIDKSHEFDAASYFAKKRLQEPAYGTNKQYWKMQKGEIDEVKTRKKPDYLTKQTNRQLGLM